MLAILLAPWMVKLYVKTAKINIVAIATILYNGNGNIPGKDRSGKGAYKMKHMTKEKAEQIYRRVAVRHQTSVDNVKKQIKLTMIAGMCSQDSEIQKKWNEIPHVGDVPTPEELLIFLSDKAKKGL